MWRATSLKTHIPLSQWIIRIEAQLGGYIGIHIDPCLADPKKTLDQPVALLRRTKPALLPAGPEATSVHVLMYPSREWIFPGIRQRPRPVAMVIDSLVLETGERFKMIFPPYVVSK